MAKGTINGKYCVYISILLVDLEKSRSSSRGIRPEEHGRELGFFKARYLIRCRTHCTDP